MKYDWPMFLIQFCIAIVAVLGYFEARAAKNHASSLRVEVNHRLTELLAEKGKAEHAAGRREGVESKSNE